MGKKTMGDIQKGLTTIDMEENKIEIYRSADGKVELNVKLEKNTVWLSCLRQTERLLFVISETYIRQRNWMWYQLVQKMYRLVLEGIADKLVALALMIAESRTEEKDVMVKVVVNLINSNNKNAYDEQQN